MIDSSGNKTRELNLLACDERVQLDSCYSLPASAISPVCAQHLKEVICQPALQFAPTLCEWVCVFLVRRKNFSRNYWAQSLIYFSLSPTTRICRHAASKEWKERRAVLALQLRKYSQENSPPPPANWCKHADDELMLVPRNVIAKVASLFSNRNDRAAAHHPRLIWGQNLDLQQIWRVLWCFRGGKSLRPANALAVLSSSLIRASA